MCISVWRCVAFESIQSFVISLFCLQVLFVPFSQSSSSFSALSLVEVILLFEAILAAEATLAVLRSPRETISISAWEPFLDGRETAPIAQTKRLKEWSWETLSSFTRWEKLNVFNCHWLWNRFNWNIEILQFLTISLFPSQESCEGFTVHSTLITGFDGEGEPLITCHSQPCQNCGWLYYTEEHPYASFLQQPSEDFVPKLLNNDFHAKPFTNAGNTNEKVEQSMKKRKNMSHGKKHHWMLSFKIDFKNKSVYFIENIIECLIDFLKTQSVFHAMRPNEITNF